MDLQSESREDQGQFIVRAGKLIADVHTSSTMLVCSGKNTNLNPVLLLSKFCVIAGCYHPFTHWEYREDKTVNSGL